MTYTSHSADDTFQIGFRLGENAKPDEIYCLSGDLGAGKTVFSQGFAAGLGVKGRVQSPTFALVREYDGRLPLYHFDVYRIIDVSEMDETGFYDYLNSGAVMLIEWAENIQEILPNSVINIRIHKDDTDENTRRIDI